MVKFCSLLAAFGLLLAVTAEAGAQAGDIVPWQMEPAPICGSDLHTERPPLGCTPVEAGTVHGRLVCPVGLSSDRLAGQVYPWATDPGFFLLYNEAGSIPTKQAIEDTRHWTVWCVAPLPTVPTSTPAPEPTPVIIVVPAPTPTSVPVLAVPAPRPSFTG